MHLKTSLQKFFVLDRFKDCCTSMCSCYNISWGTINRKFYFMTGAMREAGEA